VSDKASNLLRIAVSNSDRLIRLINDILDLERMQSGRAPLAFRSVALEDLARQAMENMQPMADSSNVHLLCDTIPAHVEADADRLLQVLTNLLSNAIKFSPAQSIVRITDRQTGDHLRPLPAGRCFRLAAERRHRSRPRHLPHHRAPARRPHLGGTERRPGLHLPGLPS
jgi:signal transduction histidine kinase